MGYGVEIQGHGRVCFDDFSTFNADASIIDQFLQTVNELWRYGISMFIAEAPCGHDGRDGRIEIAIGKTGGFLGNTEIVNEDGVKFDFFIAIDFRDYGHVDPKVDRHIHGMKDRVDFLLEVAALLIEIGDGIVRALCFALKHHLLRYSVTGGE